MNLKSELYKANGKVLLTAEYLVLMGAKALCLPLKFKGQTLEISESDSGSLKWQSYENGHIWFEAQMNKTLEIESSSDSAIAKNLVLILKEIQKLNPNIQWEKLLLKTDLNFNRHFGLGTSSTLISLLSQWSKTDPYKILQNTFGGSGYDLACAISDSALIYQKDEAPILLDWVPSFKEHLYFVYLNQKQSSKKEVESFLESGKSFEKECEIINEITLSFTQAKSLSEFEILIKLHEQTMTNVLNRPRIKEEKFNDFQGEIKSLGAWGGDFVLVTSQSSPYDYFKAKGFETILTWDQFVYE